MKDIKMKKNKLNILWAGLLSAGIFSCQTAEVSRVSDQAYYPVEKGRFWIYEVNEETYSLTGKPETNHFWLKESIGNSIRDAYDNQFYQLVRYKKNSLAESWKTDSVWLLRQLPDRLIRVENNTAYTRLIFPAEEGMKWNSNSLNTGRATDLKYLNVGGSYELSGSVYPQTLKVRTVNDSTALTMDRSTDIYAFQKGLVYKEVISVTYCQNDNCIGSGVIDFGKKSSWTLKETGLE